MRRVAQKGLGFSLIPDILSRRLAYFNKVR